MKVPEQQNDFLTSSIREFNRLKNYADKSIKLLDEDLFFRQLDPESNSVAIIVKHLAGNIKSRWSDFLTTDGEKAYRDRDKEFIIETNDSKDKLISDWNSSWEILIETLENLSNQDLSKTITIRGEPHTVIEAIVRQLPHYGFHVGQIVLLSKHLAKNNWKSLTIPKGKSKDFNKNPTPFANKVLK